ncbi:hypothetical protein BIY24_14315 [Halobacteriovorax marinus]|nr:hypothetical protein BIY24_14315 [Halobacteriovorax marinus]
MLLRAYASSEYPYFNTLSFYHGWEIGPMGKSHPLCKMFNIGNLTMGYRGVIVLPRCKEKLTFDPIERIWYKV